MDKDTLYWILSTLPQVIGAMKGRLPIASSTLFSKAAEDWGGVSIYDYLVALFRRLPNTPKDQRRQLLPHILGVAIPKQELIPIFNRSCL